MAKQFLHRAQIRTIGEQMAGEGVPQHMRRDDGRANSRPPGQGFQVTGENLARQIARLGRCRKQPGLSLPAGCAAWNAASFVP